MYRLIALLVGFNSFPLMNAASENSFRLPDSIPEIIILNGFDASKAQVRKNKKELFKELADSLQFFLARNIKIQTGQEAVKIPGYSPHTDFAAVMSVMKTNNVKKVIVIRSLDVYFAEAAEKLRDEYGMDNKVETQYDLCTHIEYAFYSKDSVSKESQVLNCELFTTRSVNDSRFVVKFGPDLIAKKKYTFPAVDKNSSNYISEISALLKYP